MIQLIKVFFGDTTFNSMLSENGDARKLLRLALDRSINIVTSDYVIQVMRHNRLLADKNVQKKLTYLFQEHNNIFEIIVVEKQKELVRQLQSQGFSLENAAMGAGIKAGKARFFATTNPDYLTNPTFEKAVGVRVFTPQKVYLTLLTYFKQR